MNWWINNGNGTVSLVWFRLLHRAPRNRNVRMTICGYRGFSLSHICTTYDQFFLCDPSHFEIMKIESNIGHVVWLLDPCLLRSSSITLVIPHFTNSVVIENGSTLFHCKSTYFSMIVAFVVPRLRPFGPETIRLPRFLRKSLSVTVVDAIAFDICHITIELTTVNQSYRTWKPEFR